MATIPFTGTKIGISKDGTTFTELGCLTGYSRAGAGRNKIDVTCANDTVKKFVNGLKDNGTLSCDLFYDPEGAGWKLLLESEESNDLYHFQIEVANSTAPAKKGSLRTFEGSVSSTTDTGSVDGVLTASVDIEISGAITRTPPES